MAQIPVGYPPVNAPPGDAVWHRWFAREVHPVINAPVQVGNLNNPAPLHSASNGTPGQIVTDGNYVYICVAAGQWKRAALANF